MLTTEQRSELKTITNAALNIAEAIWEKTGPLMQKMAASRHFEESISGKSITTPIPGHEEINEIEPAVDDFICMMIDIRGSTKHLNEWKAGCKVQQLQRVFYETSALLHSSARVLQYEGGNVTEYLGDGALGLFKATKPIDSSCYATHRAAKNALINSKEIVNPILSERYDLPPLQIGIGMALSRAIITVVGLPDNRVPKVIGQCVYRASKLCKGIDQIVTDKVLSDAWPSNKEGTLRFSPWSSKDKSIDGYLVNS